jgi:hypothetical protein
MTKKTADSKNPWLRTLAAELGADMDGGCD